MSAGATAPSSSGYVDARGSSQPSYTTSATASGLVRQGSADLNLGHFGIPRSDSSARLEADLGPSLSSVLKTFDFSSPHSSLLSRSEIESLRSDDAEGEESSDSTNLTTNPSTPAFSRDKETASAAYYLGRFEAVASPPPPPLPPAASTTAATAALGSVDAESIASLAAQFGPDRVGGPHDQIPNPGYWGTRRLLYPLHGSGELSPVHSASPPASISIPFRPAPLLSNTTAAPGILPTSLLARLHGGTEEIRTFPDTPPVADQSSAQVGAASGRTGASSSDSLSRSGSGSNGRSRETALSRRAGSIRKLFSGGPTSETGSSSRRRRSRGLSTSSGGSSTAAPQSSSLVKARQLASALAEAQTQRIGRQASGSTTAEPSEGGAPLKFPRLTSDASGSDTDLPDHEAPMPTRVQAPFPTGKTAHIDGGRSTMATSMSPPSSLHHRSGTVTFSENGSSSGPSSGIQTPAGSISAMIANARAGRERERADSFMSTATTATSHTGIVAKATIATASSATIRKVDKADLAARPIRLKNGVKPSGTLIGQAVVASAGQSRANQHGGREKAADRSLGSSDIGGSHRLRLAVEGNVHSGSTSYETPYEGSFEAGQLSDATREYALDGASMLTAGPALAQPSFSTTLSAPASRPSSRGSASNAAEDGDGAASGPISARIAGHSSPQPTNNVLSRPTHLRPGADSQTRRAAATRIDAPTLAERRQISNAVGASTISPHSGAKTLKVDPIYSKYSNARSLARASASVAHPVPSEGLGKGLAVDVGLGIRKGLRSESTSPAGVGRPNLGLALDVVPEFSEAVISPGPPSSSSSWVGSSFLSARESGFEASASSGYSRGRANSIATNVSLVEEPVWAQNHSVATSGPDLAFDTLAAFAFPSPIISSSNMPTPTPAPAQFGGSTLHSATPSMQSTASTSNGWMPASVSQNSFMRVGGHSRGLTNTTQLSMTSRSHAPASSSGGSAFSVSGHLNQLGLSHLAPTSRAEMLNRLVLDQARVDCQDYGLLSLEDVANAKRELKHLDAKIASMKIKLKVEIKIRDAATALRKAHRKAPTPTSALFSPPVSGQINGLVSPSSGSRSRGTSISISEAKADEDASAAIAKVDRVARELLKLGEKAQALRRMVLEHQAAALVERVDSLEADRAMIEEKLPRLAPSLSLSSLARAGSPTGLSKLGDTTIQEGQSATGTEVRGGGESDEPYQPRGPSYPLSHGRLDSDASLGSGFTFLDASLPDRVRRLSAELEQNRLTLDQAKRQLQATQEELEANKKQTAAIQEELENSRQTVVEANAELKRAQEQVQALQQDGEQGGPELERLRDQLKQQQRDQAEGQDLLQQSLQQRLEAEKETHATALAGRVEEARREAEARLGEQVKEHEAQAREARDQLATQKAVLDQVQRELQQARETQAQSRSTEASNLGAQTAAISAELAKVRDAHREAEQLAAARATELDRIKAAHAAVEKLAADRARDLDEVQSAKGTAEEQLAERNAKLASEQRLVESLRAQLDEEQRARLAAEARISSVQQEARDAESRATSSDASLRELELAVGAERKIMAERDELFHAFERRLESAEARLQEQDRRCARMLGKLEGREEMDDLLERIKAGAGGVSKKKKTAGQDIADLLTSLETHIEDLEDELARAGGTGVVGAASASPAMRRMENDLDEAEQEAERWRKQAEETQKQLEELRAIDGARLAAPAAIHNDSIAASPLAHADEVEDLEHQIEKLTSQNGHLDRQLRSLSASSSFDTVAGRGGVGAGSGSGSGISTGRGVGNLISKFGGGNLASRSVQSTSSGTGSTAGSLTPSTSQTSNVADDAEREAQQTQLRELRGVMSEMVRMLPALEADSLSSADLETLHKALEAPVKSPPHGALVSSPSTTDDLKAELEALSEKVRRTVAASRLAVTKALQTDSSSQSLLSQLHEAEVERDRCRTTVAQLESKLSLSTHEIQAYTEREGKLEQTIGELREQLEAARMRSPPSSTSSLGPSFNPSMLPNFSPRKNAKALVSVATSTSNSPSPRRPPPLKAFGAGGGGATSVAYGGWGSKRINESTLAPPSPGLMLEGMMPSPTKSTYSFSSSPSPSPVRMFVPPFASVLETRTGGKSPDPPTHPDHASPAPTAVSLPFVATTSSAPSLGLGWPSSTTAQSHGKQGPRTITLGMDTPSLILKIRDLERELATAQIFQKQSDKIREQEEALRAKERKIEEERLRDAEMNSRLLEELNESNRMLEVVRARAAGRT